MEAKQSQQPHQFTWTSENFIDMVIVKAKADKYATEMNELSIQEWNGIWGAAEII